MTRSTGEGAATEFDRLLDYSEFGLTPIQAAALRQFGIEVEPYVPGMDLPAALDDAIAELLDHLPNTDQGGLN